MSRVMDSEYTLEGSWMREALVLTSSCSGVAGLSPVTADRDELWMERIDPWFHSNMWPEGKVTRAEILQTAGGDL